MLVVARSDQNDVLAIDLRVTLQMMLRVPCDDR